MRKEHNSITQGDYTEFWTNNIQKLDEIHKNLDILLTDLEIEYSHFDKIYNKIEMDINVLSSIYSSYNSIDGGDYVLKLNAVINEYKKKYTADGIDFKLLNFLNDKINGLREESFKNFPEIKHKDQVPEDEKKVKEDYSRYNTRPYKWITFQRNNSWFISSFNDIELIPAEEAEKVKYIKPEIISLKLNNQKYRALDIFAEFYDNNKKSDPEFYIIVNEGKKVFAATKIGKKIYSKKDFITPEIHPFDTVKKSSLSRGHFKIFGKNHIYLS